LSFIRSLSPRSATRSWLAASAAAIALLAAMLGPAAAISGPTKLLNPGVSPRTGSPSTSITFTVSYRNRYGDAPAYVRVLIDGAPRGMRVADSRIDYHAGVRYRLVTTLALGKHQIAFTAADARKFSDTVKAGTVTIANPTSGADSSGGSTGSSSDTKPGSRPSSGSPGSTDTSTGSTAVGANNRDSSVARYEPLPGDSGGPSAPTALPARPAIGTGSEALSGLAFVGAAGGISAEERMLVTAISTTTTTVAAMAFLFFGKRRRDGEPPAPEEVLAANAALMTAVPSASVAHVDGGLPPPAGGEADESGMPRWRRPSLMAARKSDPGREESVAVKLTFDDGAAGPQEGRERRRIKYRVVRLLNAPDELRSQEIGLLDEGDEVQLLERSGSFWLVQCPDGSQGWVHRMTLGDVVDDAAPGRVDRSFADATGDIDADVLAAYLRVKGLP
jgi:hypothetical protein